MKNEPVYTGKTHIKVEVSKYWHFEKQKYVIVFLPVFVPDVTACGTLSFAPFECWENDSQETQAETRDKAILNAQNVLKYFGEKTIVLPE